MKSARELLEIDARCACSRIEGYIRGIFDHSGAKGILIGVSGGIDSALLSTLAVRAVGKDKVGIYYLYDRNSEEGLGRNARIVADWLGLKLNEMSIEAGMAEKERSAPFFMSISGLPKFALAGLSGLYRLIMGETPYLSTLRKRATEGNGFKRWIYTHTAGSIEFMFDGGCIERRKVLEEIARKENLLMLGAGNRSEEMTGWFTLGGIDNMPFSPIMGLYKTQVKQVAEYLGIPLEIRTQKPSPDMLKGVSDELTLGVDYGKIDIVLSGIERGLKDEDIMKYGPTKEEIRKVRELSSLSEWKRVEVKISRPACA